MPQMIDEAGNIWDVGPDGNPIYVGKANAEPQPAAPSSFTIGRPKPVDPNKAVEDALNAEIKRLQIEKAKQDLAKGQTGGTQGTKIDPAAVKRGNLEAMAKQLQDVEAQLQKNFIGAGDRGALEYLPTPTNKQFDAAAAGLAEQALGAFRVPGVGAQSDAELRAFVEANRPGSGEYDAVNLQRIQNIKTRLNEQRAAMGLPPIGEQAQDNQQAIPGAMPGGDPPMGGQGGGPQPGLSPEQMGAANRNAALVSALSRDRGVAAGDPNATDTAVPLPQGFNQELISYVMSNRGTITPEQLDAKVTELASRFNYPARAGNSVDVVNAVRKGAPYQGIEPARRSMSQIEQLQNKAIQSPLGSAAAGYLNAGGMGIPQMLSPDTYGAIREVNPMSSLAGEVGGAITGTSLIGKAGAAAAAKFAPKLLGGGRAAQFGRNLTTDMGFGAIYGGTTEGDPVTGALAAGLGSAGGQGLGSLAGKAIGGIAQSPAAQTLKSLGVDNLTVGQMLGGKAKGIEDAMTSWPLVGDIVNARRLEGLQDFNRAALNEAGAPIGASVADTGQAGLDDLMAQVGGAYDNATRGVTVPLDQQFTADMAAVAGARNKLPPDRAGYFDKIGENRVGPIVDAGQMTGDTYQQSMRGLKSARSSAGQVVPGFEQEYRDALTLAMDALKGQMQRGGGQKVVDGLGRADTSNRLAKTIQNAQAAAKNGTGSGEVQIFTPAQLNTAGYAAQKKYPRPRPFATLADTGQQVLPSKVPDSGTAKRLATMALPSILGGATVAGGGAGYTLGDASTGAASGAAMAALLMLGGSKAGQKAIKAALFDRPKSARAIGSAIRKRKGLFGSAPAPLLIENSAN